jgi:nucleoside-diphosphate-sugar epimerase
VVIDSSIASGGEIIYSKDAAESNVLACFADKLSQKVYNISMARPYDPHEIIETAREVFPDITINVRDVPEPGPQFPTKGYSFDITAAQQELGFKPRDLKEAMSDFAEWVRRSESPGS